MFYRCYLTTKVKAEDFEAGKGVIVVEADDYTKAEVKAIRKKGYKVLAYLSAGTIESERPWFEEYEEYCLERLEDWPNEFYADLRKTKWQKFVEKQARTLKDKGFDGWWIDNLDVYSEYKSKSMLTAICALLHKIKKLKGYIMINGGSEWLDDIIDQGISPKKYLDGYNQEEVFSRIINYSGKGKFGKQRADDSKYYKNMLIRARDCGLDTFMLEYTESKTLKASIRKFYKKEELTGYYISKRVNL